MNWHRGTSHVLNLSKAIMQKISAPEWLLEDPGFRSSIETIADIAMSEDCFIFSFKRFLSGLMRDQKHLADRVTLIRMSELAEENPGFRKKLNEALREPNK